MINAFHIEMSTYSDFHDLESKLYQELKFFKVDNEKLSDLFNEFIDLEIKMRKFHDQFRGKTISEFVNIINGNSDCMILDCTHRVELLAYVCSIQLLLTAILYNKANDQGLYVDILLSVMNQYNFRGDPTPRYFQWVIQNSQYH